MLLVARYDVIELCDHRLRLWLVAWAIDDQSRHNAILHHSPQSINITWSFKLVEFWSDFEPLNDTYTSPTPTSYEIHFVYTLEKHGLEQRSYEQVPHTFYDRIFAVNMAYVFD